jgi:DedD protein
MAEPQDALLLKRRARRRLVGAIALVLLVVIALPVVLDQEHRVVRHDLTVQIPSQDAGKFGARVLQPGSGTAAEKGSPSAAAPDSEAKRALALLSDESYVVPLGAFANPDNAKQIRDKVAAAGFKTYTERIQSKAGEQTRVRAGPFATRDSAEKARERLKALGISVGQVAPR